MKDAITVLNPFRRQSILLIENLLSQHFLHLENHKKRTAAEEIKNFQLFRLFCEVHRMWIPCCDDVDCVAVTRS